MRSRASDDAVRVVVERIDAPLVARAMVRRVADAIDRRVPHVDVGAGHVDLQAQHVCAVRKLARAHAAEEVEVLGNAAAAIGAVDARLGQRAARGAHLFRRLAVHVGEPLADEPFREAIEVVVVIRGVIAVPAPVVAQPAHGIGDRVLVLDFFLERIRVVVTQVAGAVVLGGEPEVEDDRLGVSVMQVAVRLGREARDDAPAVFAGAKVVADDRAQEVRRAAAGPAGAFPAARAALLTGSITCGGAACITFCS